MREEMGRRREGKEKRSGPAEHGPRKRKRKKRKEGEDWARPKEEEERTNLLILAHI